LRIEGNHLPFAAGNLDDGAFIIFNPLAFAAGNRFDAPSFGNSNPKLPQLANEFSIIFIVKFRGNYDQINVAFRPLFTFSPRAK